LKKVAMAVVCEEEVVCAVVLPCGVPVGENGDVVGECVLEPDEPRDREVLKGTEELGASIIVPSLALAIESAEEGCSEYVTFPNAVTIGNNPQGEDAGSTDIVTAGELVVLVVNEAAIELPVEPNPRAM